MNSSAFVNKSKLLEGLAKKHAHCQNLTYHRIKAKADKMISRLYPKDPVDWLDDCFSQAFLTLLTKIESGCYQDQNLDAFALKIVKLTYMNARRTKRSFLILTENIPDTSYQITSTPANAGELFEKLQLKKLGRWYWRLPLMKRQMLDLRMQGMAYVEIAEKLGLAHGTVRNKFSTLIAEAKQLQSG